MRIGFSSLCCPTWDLRTLLEQAVMMGYDGLELRGLQGELDLPRHPELSQNSAAVVEAFAATRVELACLGSSACFTSKRPHDVAHHTAMVTAYIELAARLACPFVRVFTGDVPAGSNRYDTLQRIADALGTLADHAARHRVGLLVENSGELASSRDLWFLLDSVSSPALQCCWNPINGMVVAERSTVAVPRLGIRTAVVHVADAVFDGAVLTRYTPLGKGSVDVARMVELLQGIGFDGYLMVEWPKLWRAELEDPATYLPSAARFLKGCLETERVPLSAYKGDKNKPTFAARTPRRPQPARTSDGSDPVE